MLYQANCTSAKILNVRNPWNPLFVSKFDTLNYWVIYGVAVSGRYLYLADCGTGILTWDISNPFFPESLGVYPDRRSLFFNIDVSGNYVFVPGLVFSGSTYGLGIIDVSNPSIPVLIDSINTPSTGDMFYISDNFLFLPWGQFSFPPLVGQLLS